MPVTKNQMLRLRVIDDLINNSLTAPTKNKIREACEEAIYGFIDGDRVSDSTIEKDFTVLRNKFNAPLKYSNQQSGYIYTEPYSFDSVPFTDKEKEALKVALGTLNKYSGIGIFKGFAEAIERLKIKVDLNQNNNLSHILFEELPEESGIQHMEILDEAIRNRNALQVKYWSSNSKVEKDYTVHPYCLKQYNRRWYAICKEPSKNRMVTFEFGRIKNVSILQSTYKIEDFNVNEYFKYSPGISVSEKAYDVKIKVNETFLVNFLSQFKLHPLQQWENNNELHFKSYLGPELIHNLKGHGKGIEVLGPKELINILAT